VLIKNNMPLLKNDEDFKSSIELLKFYLEQFELGNHLVYLPIAVELRKLLCDRNPLLPKILPEFSLPKLRLTEMIETMPWILDSLENFVPGRMDFIDGRVVKFSLSLSSKNEHLKIIDWINQMFFKENITVRELIKSVADRQGAHSDETYNSTLEHSIAWKYGDISSHVWGIYGIARLLCDNLQ